MELKPPGIEGKESNRDWTEAMYQVSRLLALEVDRNVSGILQAVAGRILAEVDRAGFSIIWVYDEASNSLSPAASAGCDLGGIDGCRLAPGEGVSGYTFLQGSSLLIEGEKQVASLYGGCSSPAYRCLISAIRSHLGAPQSAASVPLRIGQEIIGCLTLTGFSADQPLGESELHFCRAVGNLVSQFLEAAQLREENRRREERAEALSAKADLSLTLSHQMRNPLASIKTAVTSLLRTDVEWDEGTFREFLTIIDNEADDLNRMIQELLDAAALEAGAVELEFSPTNLEQVLREVSSEHARYTSRHDFLLGFSPNFPLTMCDSLRVRQVFDNIVDNAVKYSPEGGLVVIKGEVVDEGIEISVADQGIGISPEHLNRLFDRYFRAHSLKSVMGTGLGLPIARSIVEAHGGRIWASSLVGKGTTLHVFLPSRPPQYAGKVRYL